MSWLDDMSPDEYFKRMAAAQKGELPGGGKVAGGGMGGGIGDPKKFKEGMDKYLASIKATLEPQKVFTDMLNGQKQAMFDATKALEELDNALEEATDASEINAIQEAKDAIVRKTTNQNLKASAINLGMGFAKATGTLISGLAEFAKGLLSNQGGVELSTNLAAKGARATGEAVSSVGSTIGALGGIASMFMKSMGTFGKIFTVLAMLAGPLIEMLGVKAAQLAEEGIKILGDELVKTRENFKKLTSSGAMFAGGMTEMRQQAGRAGLTVDDFGNAIKNNTESLSAMGLGMSQAAKRMAGITGEIRKSGIGTQLTNLGYSMEDFASLSAQTAANLNASGRLRSMSDAQVANATLNYAKDLKVIQQLTGEDAKKKMEAARKQAMEADVYAAVMAKGGPEAVQKLQAQLALVPDELKKGYLELVSSGGEAIGDAATNIAMEQNPKLKEALYRMQKDLEDRSKGQSQALDGAKDYLKSAGDYAKTNFETTRAIGMSARFTGDALQQGATSIASSLIMIGTNWAEESSTKGRETINKLATTNDKLTTSVTGLETATYNMKVAVEKELTPMLGRYADHLKTMLETVESTVGKIKAAMNKIDADAADAAKGKGEKSGEKWGGLAGDILGGLAGAGIGTIIGVALAPLTGGLSLLIPAITGFIGMLSGGAIGDFIGTKVGGFIGSMFDDKKKPAAGTAPPPAPSAPVKKFALGGVTNERAIFGEQGPEAAVPLPDGRTIPVTLKVKDAPEPKSVKSMMTDMQNKIGFSNSGTSYNIGDKKAPSINAGSRLETASSKDQGLFDFMTKSSEDTKTTTASLNNGMEKLYTVMENQKTSAVNTEQTMKELVGIMRAQLAKNDSMIEKLSQTVDINQRILTNSYS